MNTYNHIIVIISSFSLSLFLTPIVRGFARRFGKVAFQTADRWHRKPTAMLGGVAIFIAVLITYLFLLPHTDKIWIVLGASTVLFLVGLMDDIFGIKPYQKQIGQMLGSAIIIYAGTFMGIEELLFSWSDVKAINILITIVWLLAATNAINLLDNIEGLAPGIAAITTTFVAANLFSNGQGTDALLLASFFAVLLGFLIYNANPATIFMGDCGSEFVGFFLASLCLLNLSNSHGWFLLTTLAVPTLILFIPIFDLTLVRTIRRFAGRPRLVSSTSAYYKVGEDAASKHAMILIGQGPVGDLSINDKSTHLLLTLGYSQRGVAWSLYGLAGLSGIIGLIVSGLDIRISAALTLGFSVVLTLLGVYVLRVQIHDQWDFYQEQQSERLMLEGVRRFFINAGAQVINRTRHIFHLNTATGRLRSFIPLPVLVATGQSNEENITELVSYSAELLKNQRAERAGIFIYRAPPNVLVRMKIAEVRLRDRFILIPMSYAAIEQALLNSSACAGTLAEYVDRYLPGADLFDDRNAIGDTLSFFGRTELLHRIEKNLLSYQSVGLFGLRKSGKTSVLLQLGFALRHHPVVHIDLQSYGGNDLFGASIFNEILGRLSTLLKERDPLYTQEFEAFPSTSLASELVQEFARRFTELANMLRKTGYEPPVLCFFDEVERILPTAYDSKQKVEEFNALFGALRAISQEQKKISILIADVHPDCNRINNWPQGGVPTNPVNHFFKEVFLQPLSLEETSMMIVDIGRLMGRAFDENTIEAIHRESGGFPFISRQLASLVCSRVESTIDSPISWDAACRFIEKPFTYSGVLKDYLQFNIWEDLERRRFTSAMRILQTLAFNRATDGLMSEEALHSYTRDIDMGQVIDAVLWLEAAGLLGRIEANGISNYKINVLILKRWLLLNFRKEDRG